MSRNIARYVRQLREQVARLEVPEAVEEQKPLPYLFVVTTIVLDNGARCVNVEIPLMPKGSTLVSHYAVSHDGGAAVVFRQKMRHLIMIVLSHRPPQGWGQQQNASRCHIPPVTATRDRPECDFSARAGTSDNNCGCEPLGLFSVSDLSQTSVNSALEGKHRPSPLPRRR